VKIILVANLSVVCRGWSASWVCWGWCWSFDHSTTVLVCALL